MFEPEYLRLFDHLLEVHPGGAGAHFLHVLHPSAAPPALLDEAGTVAGLPRVGCCAEVHAVRRLAGGELQVDYSGGRRARLLSLEQEEPFKVRRWAGVRVWALSLLYFILSGVGLGGVGGSGRGAVTCGGPGGALAMGPRR